MQHQRREDRVEKDEYEREQQRLAKQIKRGVVLRNDRIFAFCMARKRAHILELFKRNAYALPSFSHFVAHVLVQRSWRCARAIHCEYVHLVNKSTYNGL